MKVCSYKGLSIVIMLRDEHCPPHVHVNAGSWSARLQFSGKTLLTLIDALEGVEIDL